MDKIDKCWGLGVFRWKLLGRIKHMGGGPTAWNRGGSTILKSTIHFIFLCRLLLY